MNHRRNAIFVMLIASAAAMAGWQGYRAYAERQFVWNLQCLVGCSTSMIGTPTPEKERSAHQRAKDLNIDVMTAYKQNQSRGCRCGLAWLLISMESTGYADFAMRNIETVPWCEVRIWRVRHRDTRLSPEFRQQLVNLLLASPTPEAKLAVGRMRQKEGKIGESEDAFHAAMTNGLFWDSVDAARELMKSDRYREDAVAHLLKLLRETDPFIEAPAYVLVNHYGVRREFESLIEKCRRDKPGRPLRNQLLSMLSHNIGAAEEAHPAKSSSASN